MLISTSINLTSANLAASLPTLPLPTLPLPTIAPLQRDQISNLVGTLQRGIGSSGYGFGLGCASSGGHYAIASGMGCMDEQMVDQSHDLELTHEGILGSHYTKPAVAANEERSPVNYRPIWKPVAFINNLNRLTFRWQEPSI